MKHLLDVKDAAAFLNVSEMTIRRWTNSGRLKCYRLGGRRDRRFQKSDLDEFSGAYIMMAAEVHRQTIYRGRMEKSPYCT